MTSAHFHLVTAINRRIGGLEKRTKLMSDVADINRRIGGLEILELACRGQ